MSYKIKHIPARGSSGFTYEQLKYISKILIDTVNKDGIDLLLDTKHVSNIRYDSSYKIKPKFIEIATPWQSTVHNFFGEEYTKPAVISIQIDNCKMKVIKSVYAIRETFKRMGVKIEETR